MNDMNAIQQLATNGTGVASILASLVVVEFIVIVYQWKYTKDNTVPKELFYKQEEKFNDLSKITADGFKTLGSSLLEIGTIIKERLQR